LVFSQYVDETFGVAAAVRRLKKFNPLSITGLTPQGERSGVIDSFKREAAHKVLVLSLRVGGLGLNLQEASYVFYMDRWWNPATERQSEDRSHRIGQARKVSVFKYSCVGTIEERIDEILASKQRLFDEMVDDVSADLGARLSRDDLHGLFRLAGAPESG
ncbi:MAG: C-terminal helicase domain-containing protein, partial [Bryobacterales bacterium]|nr:C-terminal helicase domain-containing protein [Bryobacterales bacterium]